VSIALRIDQIVRLLGGLWLHRDHRAFVLVIHQGSARTVRASK
jgi:hypothetical protein